jgi:hypothetical protein
VLLAMMMTALLATAVALVLGDLNHRQLEFRREARILTLCHLTDAAVAETLAGLAMDPEWMGIEPMRLNDGTVRSAVTRAGEGKLRILAEARYDGWRGFVEAEVSLIEGTPVVVEWSRRTSPATS